MSISSARKTLFPRPGKVLRKLDFLELFPQLFPRLRKTVTPVVFEVRDLLIETRNGSNVFTECALNDTMQVNTNRVLNNIWGVDWSPTKNLSNPATRPKYSECHVERH